MQPKKKKNNNNSFRSADGLLCQNICKNTIWEYELVGHARLIVLSESFNISCDITNLNGCPVKQKYVSDKLKKQIKL